jgi:hypothetical protein
MQTTLLPVLSNEATIASCTPVDLDSIKAAHFVRGLVQQLSAAPSHMLVDYSYLKCLPKLGISYVVSQLLVLNQGGARVFRRNAKPVLQRCLQALQSDSLFSIN